MKEYLTTEYIEKNKSLKQLCEELHCGIKFLRKQFEINGIKIRKAKRDFYKDINLSFGKKINKWLISNKVKKVKSHVFVFATCECGRSKWVSANYLFGGRSKMCRHCAKEGQLSGRWKGHGEISGTRWHIIKDSASGRRGGKKKQFKISIEYIWNLFLKQNRLCALSGLPIKFAKNYKDSTTASLDRIDSAKGYIEGNVQWTHKEINKIKLDLSVDRFLFLCEEVTKFNS